MSKIYTGAEARALREAASVGSWKTYETVVYIGTLFSTDADGSAAFGGLDLRGCPRPRANAVLIAAAPDLCHTIEALEARAEAAEARCAVLEAKQALVEAAVVNLLTAARNDLQAMFEQGDTE